MNIQDFLNDAACPPPIGKGKSKSLTLYCTQDEYDQIQNLAHHPKTKHMYDGKLYEVVRHALYFFLWDMQFELDENDWQPMFKSLKDTISLHNLNISKEDIFNIIDAKAKQMNLLLDFGMRDGALKEYQSFLEEVVKLPEWWQRVFKHMIHEHQEMSKFLDKYEKGDQMGIQDLQGVWTAVFG